MNNWFGILKKMISSYPQLYPGYTASDLKPDYVPRVGVGFMWVFVAFCIFVLATVFILLWWNTEPEEGQNDGKR